MPSPTRKDDLAYSSTFNTGPLQSALLQLSHLPACQQHCGWSTWPITLPHPSPANNMMGHMPPSSQHRTTTTFAPTAKPPSCLPTTLWSGPSTSHATALPPGALLGWRRYAGRMKSMAGLRLQRTGRDRCEPGAEKAKKIGRICVRACMQGCVF